MTQPMLDLEFLDGREGPGVVHVLMPCMAYACGDSILTKRGGFTCGPSNWEKVTCPDCRAFGRDVLAAECRRQQGAS